MLEIIQGIIALLNSVGAGVIAVVNDIVVDYCT